MKIENVNSLLFNLAFTSRLLLHFLNGTKNKMIKTELIYFVLPILYNEKLLDKLNKCMSTSSLKTFLNDDTKRELINFPNQTKNFSELSNQSIITLSNIPKINISITDYITINTLNKVDYKKEIDPLLKRYFKAAHYLGLIISKDDYKTIFYKFQ